MRWLKALRTVVSLAGRERVHSRPRVAIAARAASEVRTAPALSGARVGGLGSATAGVGVYVIAELGLAGIAPVAGREDAGGLAHAAVAAARAAGRDPREVWQEALAEWLLAREWAGAREVSLPRAGRRERDWLEIDATVAALRGA